MSEGWQEQNWAVLLADVRRRARDRIHVRFFLAGQKISFLSAGFVGDCDKCRDSSQAGAGLYQSSTQCRRHQELSKLFVFRSQDVVPRGAGWPQSDQLSPPGKVATGRPAGRRHDGPLCRLRAAHPGQVPAQRAGQSVARQVRAVLRVQLQPHREVLLPGWQALLQN